MGTVLPGASVTSKRRVGLNVVWTHLVLLAVSLPGVWALLWPPKPAASSHPSSERVVPSAAPTPSPIVIREIVREVEAASPKEVASAEAPDPELIEELAAQEEADRLARTAAYLEAGFQAAAAPDRAWLQTESYLDAALDEVGARTRRIECRSSFCRIGVSFDGAASAEEGLKKIFMSGPSEHLPNLASTVSRTVADDGTVHAKVYLHPDAFSQAPLDSESE